MAAWLEREKARPFDFTVAPLFRLVVHRLSARRFQLALSFHHAILDGWSVATLLAELFTEYEGRRQGSGPSRTDVSGLCGAGAGGLGVGGSGRVLGSALAGQRAAKLPRAPRAERSSLPGRLGVVETALDAALAAQLKQLAVTAGVPLKSVLLAAHLRVLALVTGAERCDQRPGGPQPARGGRRRAAVGAVPQHAALRLQLAAERDGPGTHPKRLRRRAVRICPIAAIRPAAWPNTASGQPAFETAFNYNHFHVYQGLAGPRRPRAQRPADLRVHELHAVGELRPGAGRGGAGAAAELRRRAVRGAADRDVGRLLPPRAGGAGRGAARALDRRNCWPTSARRSWGGSMRRRWRIRRARRC